MLKHGSSTSHQSTEPIIHAAGPEWAVFCDALCIDQYGSTLWHGDSASYRTVLQVVSMDGMQPSALPAAAAWRVA